MAVFTGPTNLGNSVTCGLAFCLGILVGCLATGFAATTLLGCEGFGFVMAGKVVEVIIGGGILAARFGVFGVFEASWTASS